MRLAVLGASGFIGSRAVEMLHLEQFCDLRAIVRGYGSMASLSRFNVDIAVTDPLDEDKLADAIMGCDDVLQCIVGDRKVILRSAEACFNACKKAKVRRMIYISSTAVHGLDPASDTDEESPISDNQPLPYNNAKVQAERLLLQRSASGGPELVILRPGIVYGPRSARWTQGIATELLTGQACLVDDGNGVCNAVYVDNVIEAVKLALKATADAVHRQAFLVNDAETVTWSDLYEQLALALNIDPASITRVRKDQVRIIAEDPVRAIQSSSIVQSILPFLPARVKSSAKAALTAWLTPPQTDRKDGGNVLNNADATVASARSESPSAARLVRVTAEMAALQNCRWKLPNTKAKRVLGYQPPVSFSEGCARTAEWLDFAGFPVRKDLQDGFLPVGSARS